MQNPKTNTNKLYILLTNTNQGFNCDYVDRTAEILSLTNFVIIAYYNKPHAIGNLIIHLNELINILISWWKIIKNKNDGIIHCEFVSIFPFQRIKTIYAINRRLTSIELRFILFLRMIYQKKRNYSILWIFHPTAEFFVGTTGEKESLFDCVDYIEELKDYSEEIFLSLKLLLKKVKFVFANSDILANRFKNLRKDIVVVPCGCIVDEFPKNYRPKVMPEKLRSIKKPIIGFYGNLDYRLDFDLIENLLLHHKNYSLVFIGDILEKVPKFNYNSFKSVKAALSNFKKYPNFFNFPSVSKSKLKDYLYYFNIAIIPYNLKYKIVYYSNPMKFYEYLALGMPVISVPIPSLQKYRRATISFCYSMSEFSRSINLFSASKLRIRAGKNLSRSIAEKNSWGKKIKAIIREITRANKL